MVDPLKDIHGRSFVEGQDAIAKQVSAKRMTEHVAATGKAVGMAADAIDLADQLAVDGNPHKKQLAELLKDTAVEAAKRLAAEGQTLEDGVAAAAAAPFSNDSPSSLSSLEGSTPKSLPHEQQPPKRPRGRPPKNRGN